MKKKKITTIEDLATLAQEEFLKINENFSEVNKRLDKLQKEVAGIRAD